MAQYLAEHLEALVLLLIAFVGVIWNGVTVHFRLKAAEAKIKELEAELEKHKQESEPVRTDVTIVKERVEGIREDVTEIKRLVSGRDDMAEVLANLSRVLERMEVK